MKKKADDDRDNHGDDGDGDGNAAATDDDHNSRDAARCSAPADGGGYDEKTMTFAITSIPAGTEVQAAVPVDTAYVPAGQTVQADAPASA